MSGQLTGVSVGACGGVTVCAVSSTTASSRTGTAQIFLILSSSFSTIFKCASTGRQRQKFIRLLSISDRFKVVAVCTGCDDHLKPMPPRFLDVEHVSSILDV